MPQEIVPILCIWPERMHPVSAQILDLYLHRRLPEAEFLRAFSLPNSDYIPLSQCIVAMLNTLGLM
ncbi:MAG: hypothetical protein H6843_03480 [Rhodospirillaceae bacterium]|nr:hypothetical protein [Rhodospirillaceae bacterium]